MHSCACASHAVVGGVCGHTRQCQQRGQRCSRRLATAAAAANLRVTIFVSLWRHRVSVCVGMGGKSGCFDIFICNYMCYTKDLHLCMHVWRMHVHGCMYVCVILKMVSCRVLALTPFAGDCQYSYVRYVSVARLCQLFPSVKPKAALKWKNRGPKVCCPCKKLDIKCSVYL